MTDKITKYVSLSLNGICKLKKDDIVVVALSGGMDSMCLFDVTYKLSNDYGFKMMALHVHHGIRGKDADRDLEFVENYCKSFDVPFIKCKVKAKTYAKENGLTIEEAARILRYKEIDNVWKKVLSKNPDSCVYILLAHHMRDQVETIIHNILRGTGVKGLSGMNDMRDYIIRPMLNVSKDDIEKCHRYYPEINQLNSYGKFNKMLSAEKLGYHVGLNLNIAHGSFFVYRSHIFTFKIIIRVSDQNYRSCQFVRVIIAA